MNLDDYRRRHDQAATLAAVLAAGLGCAGALLPAVEHAVAVALLAATGLAVLTAALRTGARVLRERREDRADAFAGAVWRAEHMPHLSVVAGAERTGAR
jgi:hypothetical protein